VKAHKPRRMPRPDKSRGCNVVQQLTRKSCCCRKVWQTPKI
jgi:hypothetical protein